MFPYIKDQNGSLQGTFTRMKSRLTSIKRKRKLILSVIILLHNFRTEVVGLNQIATVFNVEYESWRGPNLIVSAI